MNTGNSLYISRNHSDSLGSRRNLVVAPTGSPLVVPQQMPMYGRMRQPSQEQDLNLARNHSTEVTLKIGTRSRHWQNVENWMISLVTYTLEITCHSRESCQTAWNQLQSNGQFTVFGSNWYWKISTSMDRGWIGRLPKDPRTKFWDGYRNHEHVVIDEFRGGIDIGRYPVIVEIKGSSTVLKATKIWITSNLDPRRMVP